jgi:AraC-like DNA-binding protein
MAFVRAIVRGYERYGQDACAALAEARITPRELADPSGRVTAAQFETLSGHAMQALDDEALGWFSRRLPWGSYGLLCRASLGAPDLGVAIKRWCRHHRLLTDDVDLTLEVHAGSATVTVHERRDFGDLREFCLVSLLRFLHGFACWAIDSRITLSSAGFPFAAPAHHDAYALLFGAELHFGAAHASYRFDARYLALPLQRDERALRTMLKRALPLTVLQYRRDRLLGQRVRELLRQRNAAGGSTAETLAARLNLSSRTLHRQLLEEGVSLQALKDQVRHEQAADQLRRSDRPIKQIALAAGFRNEKSFSRAFRTWAGVTPGAYRRGELPEPPPTPLSVGRTDD